MPPPRHAPHAVGFALAHVTSRGCENSVTPTVDERCYQLVNIVAVAVIPGIHPVECANHQKCPQATIPCGEHAACLACLNNAAPYMHAIEPRIRREKTIVIYDNPGVSSDRIGLSQWIKKKPGSVARGCPRCATRKPSEPLVSFKHAAQLGHLGTGWIGSTSPKNAALTHKFFQLKQRRIRI